MASGEFAPVVDRSGRWASFCTREAACASIQGPARFSEPGVPVTAAGLAAHVVDLASGEVRRLGGPESTSWRPSFSQTGDRLTFFGATGIGPPRLWVHDLATHVERLVTGVVVKPKLWAGDAPVWANDSRGVFVALRPDSVADGMPAPTTPSETRPDDTAPIVAMRSGHRVATALASHYRGENASDIAYVDVDSGAVRIVVDHTAEPPPSVVQLSPSGTWLAYLSVYRREGTGLVHDLAVVRSDGGPSQVIAAGLPVPVGQYFLHSYIWHPTEDRLFWLADDHVTSLGLSEPGSEPEDVLGAPGKAVWPLALTPTGDRLIVGVDPTNGTDDSHPALPVLAIVDLTAARPTEYVTTPDGFAPGHLIESRPGVAWQPTDASVTVSSRHLGDDLAAVHALTSGQPGSQLWALAGRITPVGIDAHNRLVLTYEDLDIPRDLYVLDLESGGLKQVTTIEPTLRDHHFGIRQRFQSTIPTGHGDVAVATTVIRPPTAAGALAATIVIGYPGGTCSGDATEYGGGTTASLPTAALLMHGFQVALVDIPLGRGAPADDIAAIVDGQVQHAVEQGYINPERLALLGHSYGAYGVAAILTRTDRYRAGVALCGMYDLAGYGAHLDLDTGLTKWAYVTSGQGRMDLDPWTALPTYTTNSPFYTADQITTPLLLIHGGKDPMYPAAESTKLFSALEHLAKAPTELVIYRQEGHTPSTWSLSAAEDALARICSFLDARMT